MLIYLVFILLLILLFLHFISYYVIKNKIVKSKNWGLNICCGKTDGGGVNADIIQHKKVPNFIKIRNIYNLPFKSKQFKTVLCSHTLEHVNDPKRFYNELKRVGEEITLILPPLWDILAIFTFLEHKWIFLTFKNSHNDLPMFVKLPLASLIQEYFGQRIHA